MAAATVIFDLYGTLVDLGGRPVPGVGDLLAELSATGARFAVATSDHPRHARALLAALGVEELFTVVCGARPPVARSKTEIVTDALESLGLPDPATVVMVGDRPQDMDAAGAHGLRAVGVTWGAASAGELGRQAGVEVVGDVSHLRRVLSAFVAAVSS